MKHKNIIIFLSGVLGLLSACATSNYQRGHKAMLGQNYDLAIAYLKQALAENANNAYAVRDIGIATIGKGKIDQGIKLLRMARLRIPKDGLTLYHLGLAYERKGDLGLAITTFRYYRDLADNNKEKRQIEARLQSLIKSHYTSEARKILAREKQLNIAQVPANTIAVLYFHNIGDSRDLDPLQKGITEMMINDLSKVKKLKVVERAQLQCLLNEMGLAETGIVGDETVPRMGKLLGVAKLIQGSFFEYSNEEMRIDAAMLDTRKKIIRPMGNLRGKIKNIFRLEKMLVFHIIDRMKIKLSPEENDAIMMIPTENILALMAYCRGLDMEDRGLFDQALQEYKDASKLDKNFIEAKQGIFRSEAMKIAKSGIADPGRFALPVAQNYR